MTSKISAFSGVDCFITFTWANAVPAKASKINTFIYPLFVWLIIQVNSSMLEKSIVLPACPKRRQNNRALRSG